MANHIFSYIFYSSIYSPYPKTIISKPLIQGAVRYYPHKAYIASAVTGLLIERYFLSLLFSILLSLLHLPKYYRLLNHYILYPKTLCPICHALFNAYHISLTYSFLLSTSTILKYYTWLEFLDLYMYNLHRLHRLYFPHLCICRYL